MDDQTKNTVLQKYKEYDVLYNGKYGLVLQKGLGDNEYELLFVNDSTENAFKSNHYFREAWMNSPTSVLVGGTHSALYGVSYRDGFVKLLPLQTHMFHDNADRCIIQEKGGETHIWRDVGECAVIGQTYEKIVYLNEYAYATAYTHNGDLCVLKIDYDGGNVIDQIQVNRYQKDPDGRPSDSLCCGYGLVVRDGKLFFTNEYRIERRRSAEFFMEIGTEPFSVLNQGIREYKD